MLVVSFSEHFFCEWSWDETRGEVSNIANVEIFKHTQFNDGENSTGLLPSVYSAAFLLLQPIGHLPQPESQGEPSRTNVLA